MHKTIKNMTVVNLKYDCWLKESLNRRIWEVTSPKPTQKCPIIDGKWVVTNQEISNEIHAHLKIKTAERSERLKLMKAEFSFFPL